MGKGSKFKKMISSKPLLLQHAVIVDFSIVSESDVFENLAGSVCGVFSEFAAILARLTDNTVVYSEYWPENVNQVFSVLNFKVYTKLVFVER
jgi:hypothetical protein